jgi:hypothetical protein
MKKLPGIDFQNSSGVSAGGGGAGAEAGLSGSLIDK